MNQGEPKIMTAKDREIFENLFVLEAANNHWGNLDRGIKIIRDYGTVVRANGIKAAIKFQFRNVATMAVDGMSFTWRAEISPVGKTWQLLSEGKATKIKQ